MNRILKTFLLTAATLSCAVCALFLGCNKDNSYSGEYSYSSYGTEYGFKVKVGVEDGKITSVKIADSDYVAISEANENYGWTESNVAVWTDNVNSLLESYVGKTVEEVLAIEVLTDDDGAPYTGQDLGGLVVSGATQSSGRLLLAVQNAIKELAE